MGEGRPQWRPGHRAGTARDRPLDPVACRADRDLRLTAPPGAPLATGQAVGERIATGRARVVRSAADLGQVQPGEILVAEMTDPDWEPVMRRVAAIVTDKGGRTAHAAIVSREFGLPCIVGTGSATERAANR